MTQELRITRARGGNRHPMSSRDFIITWLSMVEEDYPANIHRAYKRALDQLAVEKGRRYAYRKPHYHSFGAKISELTGEGIIEFTGREEESDNPQFDSWETKPVRRYYRLARPPAELPVLPISLDGARHDGLPRVTLAENGKGT